MTLLASPYDQIARRLAFGFAVLFVVALVVSLIGERHERRRAEAAVCAAELKALKARAPIVQRLVMPADPCVALRVVNGS